jgi:hypothetical protein
MDCQQWAYWVSMQIEQKMTAGDMRGAYNLTEDFSVPFAGNRDESTTPEPTQEYPSHNDNLDVDASEMAMLELLVLCDLSGSYCGFYDDLLTLLR